MLCGHCRWENKLGTRFCVRCGRSLVEPAAVVGSPKTVRLSGWRRLGGAAICIVSLAAGVAAYYWFWEQRGWDRLDLTQTRLGDGTYLVVSRRGKVIPLKELHDIKDDARSKYVRLVQGERLSGPVVDARVRVLPARVVCVARKCGESDDIDDVRDRLFVNNTKLERLFYINRLHQRGLNGRYFTASKIEAWASGDQIGYGELSAPVPLYAELARGPQAVIILRTHGDLAPGLYRVSGARFWAGRTLMAGNQPCVNVWLGDPDFGRPLVKPCGEGERLTESERAVLDVGRAIRRYLDATYPGWGFAAYESAEDKVCKVGRPWPPFNVWGDFNGDGATDYAVQVYQKSRELLVVFVSQGPQLVAMVAENAPMRGSESYVWHPYLTVAAAGEGYFDHENQVSGTFPHDAVVRSYCESGAIAYLIDGRRIRRIVISD